MGEDSDIRIIRADQDDVVIELDRIEDKLIPICYALRPKPLRAFPKHVKTLNELEELKDFVQIPPEKESAKKANA